MNQPTKICEQCGQEFPKAYTTSRLTWSKQKYCSCPCRAKGAGLRNRGRKDTDEMRLRKSLSLRGEKHPNFGKRLSKKHALALKAGARKHAGDRHERWKGDAASGRSIHRWVNRHWPRQGRCEWCFKETEWTQYANLNGHEYSHEREHFIELCIPCHHSLDGRIKDKAGRFAGRT